MRSVIQVFSFDLISKGLLGFLGTVLIRFLPDTEYATYTVAISIIAFVSQAISSSFNRVFIVGHDRLNHGDLSSSCLGLQLLIILSCVALTFPVRNVITDLYWLIVICIIAACFSDFGKTIFQQELAFYKFSIIEFSRTVCFGVSLVGFMYYLRYNLKAWHPIFLQAVSMFIVFFVALRRRFRVSGLFKVKDSLVLGSSILKGDYRYLFGYFVLVALFVQVDVFMLKAIGVEIDLATYGAAFRYYALVSLGLGAVHVVLLPLIQKVRSRGELEGIFARHLRMVFVFGVAVLFCAWVSKWIIPWVDKGKYPDAVLVFRILAISAIISFAFSPHANLIFRFEDFKFLFTLICITIALSVGLNYFFIPILGAIGSAIASLIAYCCINGTIYVRARKFRASFN